jgi:hypothetical protein
MGVQRYKLPSGAVRYQARVKWQGRYVATRVFEPRLLRSPGPRTSGDGFASASGSTRVVARCRYRP